MLRRGVRAVDGAALERLCAGQPVPRVRIPPPPPHRNSKRAIYLNMDQLTIDTYNQLAQEYDQETAIFWDRFPRTFFDRFIRLVDGGGVLDVGSGPGRDGLILKRAGLDVTCLDASEAMVELCSRRALKAILGDFNNLPFTKDSFDACWAYTALLHVPKARIAPALAEISRVLRPGGVFGLGMIEGKSEGYRQSAGAKHPRWFSYYTEEEIKDLLERHKFAVIYSEKFKPRTNNYLNFISRKPL